MQTFKDPETGQFWQFDDDVVVEGADGHRMFIAPNGEQLSVPVTLVPAWLPPLEELVPEPYPVSRWQGREAMRLTAHGDPLNGVSLFDATEVLLARPETPAYYRSAWEELQVFDPESPMLAAIADELGLAESDLRTLFLFAGTLRA
ncbi:hypothetical protein [Achromobacter spanius]|uniref:Uncharacterized protein n=1 Tax=Achromobacter spanius TaxID=217203 RepID=A0A2S0IDN4_9BURK|nr:hypothetical protein [Achromobacter spanius]AVJ30153.1 hypothetical protein CLM73_25340 [Achromobacter spanius]